MTFLSNTSILASPIVATFGTLIWSKLLSLKTSFFRLKWLYTLLSTVKNLEELTLETISQREMISTGWSTHLCGLMMSKITQRLTSDLSSCTHLTLQKSILFLPRREPIENFSILWKVFPFSFVFKRHKFTTLFFSSLTWGFGVLGLWRCRWWWWWC